MRLLQAVGGSTNGVVHLAAIAGRLGFDLDISEVDRLEDPDLDVAADDVLVLKNAGPKGAPGMPEAGYIQIPKKLAAAGVKDMVRISDARISGTALGAIVLHISLKAANGGRLALVRTGDEIRLDVEAGMIELDVVPAELDRRRAAWTPPAHVKAKRGYHKLYYDEALQAEDGCDVNFLRRHPRDRPR